MGARIWKTSRNKEGLKSHDKIARNKRKSPLNARQALQRGMARVQSGNAEASLFLKRFLFIPFPSPPYRIAKVSLAPCLSLICTIAQHNCGTISSAVRKISFSLSFNFPIILTLSLSFSLSLTHTHTHTHIRLSLVSMVHSVSRTRARYIPAISHVVEHQDH